MVTGTGTDNWNEGDPNSKEAGPTEESEQTDDASRPALSDESTDEPLTNTEADGSGSNVPPASSAQWKSLAEWVRRHKVPVRVGALLAGLALVAGLLSDSAEVIDRLIGGADTSVEGESDDRASEFDPIQLPLLEGKVGLEPSEERAAPIGSIAYTAQQYLALQNVACSSGTDPTTLDDLVERALEEPTSIADTRDLVNALVRSDRWDDATTLAARALEIGDRVSALNLLSWVQFARYEREGQDDLLDEAERTSNEALAADPSNFDAQVIAARVHGAREDVQRATDILDSVEAGGYLSYIRIVRAELLYEAGDSAAADDLYELVLIAEPDNAAALLQRGWIALNRGRTDQALQFSERLVALSSGKPCSPATTYVLQGAALLADGRAEEAASVFRESLETEESVDAYRRLGSALAAAGQLDESMAALERGLVQFPDSAALTLARCFTQRTHGTAQAALPFCDEAIDAAQTDEDRDRALHERAKVAYSMGMSTTTDEPRIALLTKSLADYDAMSKFTPQIRGARAYYTLDDLGRSDEAIAELRGAAVEDPADWWLLRSLGHLLAIRSQDAVGAADALLRADELNPRDEVLANYESTMIGMLSDQEWRTLAKEHPDNAYIQSLTALAALDLGPQGCGAALAAAEVGLSSRSTWDYGMQVLGRVHLLCGDTDAATDAFAAARALNDKRHSTSRLMIAADLTRTDFTAALNAARAYDDVSGELCLVVRLAAASYGVDATCGGGGRSGEVSSNSCNVTCQAFTDAEESPAAFATIVSNGWNPVASSDSLEVFAIGNLPQWSNPTATIALERLRQDVPIDTMNRLTSAVESSDATSDAKAKVMLLAGSAWTPTDDVDAVSAWLERACSLATTWDYPCELSGRAYLRRAEEGDPALALSAFEEAIERNRQGPYPPHFLGKAEALIAAGDAVSARDVLDYAATLPDANVDGLARLSDLLAAIDESSPGPVSSTGPD